jgi:hypothetical protein
LRYNFFNSKILNIKRAASIYNSDILSVFVLIIGLDKHKRKIDYERIASCSVK